MNIREIGNSGELENGKITIGIANLKVHSSHILKSIQGVPQIELRRYVQIVRLLNQAIRKDCNVDILVLPEVSIPHQMVPLLQRFSRTRNLAIVAGIEHRLDTGSRKAYNEVMVILPYKNEFNVDACRTYSRLKRYYSPGEAALLEAHHINVPEGALDAAFREDYDLFKWRGCAFSVINCFELTHIQERSEFREKVDFVVAVEWNPDTNYFATIAESASRDLHCFFIQVNTSDYGDSRVISPQKTSSMNLVRVKGGINTTLLTCELPIQELRYFQCLSANGQQQNPLYKPTPAGFDCSVVRERIGCEFPNAPS